MNFKAAKAVEFSLSEDGEVMVAFAGLGDPADQKIEDIDKDNDVSLVGSMPVGKEVPISSYAHASWPERGGRLPVGKGVIEEKGKLGVLKGRFFTDTTPGRDTYLTVKGLGSLQEWSFGYEVTKGSKGVWAGEQANLNEVYDVHEVSPVLIGAGNGTRTLEIKEGGDPGSPLEVHFTRVLGEVDGFLDRAKALADLRASEGKEMSDTNRQRLVLLVAALEEAIEVKERAEALLVAAAPGPDPQVIRSIEGEWLATEARISALLTN